MRWIVPLSYSTSQVIARYGYRSSFSLSASQAINNDEQHPVRLKSFDSWRYSNPPAHGLLFIVPPCLGLRTEGILQ